MLPRSRIPVPTVEPPAELDRPTMASPPPDFGLDDQTLRHSGLPFGRSDSEPADDDRPTPVDALNAADEERIHPDTDPAPPPEDDETA
jgi:hypothetical protein